MHFREVQNFGIGGLEFPGMGWRKKKMILKESKIREGDPENLKGGSRKFGRGF